MKFKMAVASMAVAAMVTAPAANAAPNNGNGSNRNTTNIGQTISAIAKSGGGAAGVLGALVQLKPGNLGLLNALQKVTAPKTTTQTTTATPTVEPTA